MWSVACDTLMESDDAMYWMNLSGLRSFLVRD